MESLSCLEREAKVTHIVFIPQVVGERHNCKKTFYGHLCSISYNEFGHKIGSGANCQVYAETEKQCKIKLQAGMQRAMNITLDIFNPLSHEVKPVETFGLCANPQKV